MGVERIDRPRGPLAHVRAALRSLAARPASARRRSSCASWAPAARSYDIARTLGGRLLAQLESDAPRATLFSTMLDLMRDPARPTLLIIEDINWADEA
jgi:hypothetical protein